MKTVAPYQLFFPLGIFSALLAVGVWFVQDLHWFSTPVILIHSRLIVGGFLWSFITGFLMTAVPRMSGGARANVFDKIAAAILLSSGIVASWSLASDAFYISQMLLIVFLMFFAARRIIGAQKDLPVFFSHVGLAMVLAFTGAIAHYRGNYLMGLHLYHLGAILLLILGLGTRFFSFLSGLPSSFEQSESLEFKWIFHAAGLATAIELYLAGSGLHAAYLGLAALASFYLFAIWKIQRRAKRPSPLRAGVFVVALTMPVGFLLCFINPELFITWLHLIFIGVFALMTFSVATRVTLAHGSYSTDLELNSKALWAFLIFLLIAVACRLGYGFTAGLIRKNFLHLAATAWFAAVLFWCFAFLSRIFVRGPQSNPRC